MKLRIRMPGLDVAALRGLDRKARLFLGRHAASVQSVEIARLARAGERTQQVECEVLVSLRDGRVIRVHDDENHVHRALLRAAWRIDQRRELDRLRERNAPWAADESL